MWESRVAVARDLRTEVDELVDDLGLEGEVGARYLAKFQEHAHVRADLRVEGNSENENRLLVSHSSQFLVEMGQKPSSDSEK